MMDEFEKRFVEKLSEEHRTEMSRKDEIIRLLKEQLCRMEYAFKGAVGEHMTVRLAISSHMLPSSANDISMIDEIAQRATKRMAHDVEERLGSRFELLQYRDRAERHIYYLENHARSRGVEFTPFAIREFK